MRQILYLRYWVSYALIVGCIHCSSSELHAFIFDDAFTPWTRTASGNRSGNGAPGTLTWSFVPDGTAVSDGDSSLGGSDLIDFLNQNFEGDPNQTDHTQQPWFTFFEESFLRWDELSGLRFVYEPNDDGITNNTRRRGILGTRGDIRISGASVDGPGGVLAFNFFPEFGGDMTLDTDEVDIFTNRSGNYRRLRNTIMHELGHAFGLAHVESDSALLMEPFTQSSFDGPQLDEVRAIQFFFGDAFEEANDGLGNGSANLATDLGPMRFGQPIEIGMDAVRTSQRVSPSQTDFVSISNLEDIDYYAFQVSELGTMTAELMPEGGVFTQASENFVPETFDANARSPLSLAILDSSGETILEELDLELGEGGSIVDLSVSPGTYFARVSGGEDTIQLYALELAMDTVLDSLPGDYNDDGIVDGADFTVWRDAQSDLALNPLNADGNRDGVVDQLDFDLWEANFGAVDETLLGGTEINSVPEPAMTNFGFAFIVLCLLVRPKRSAR